MPPVFEPFSRHFHRLFPHRFHIYSAQYDRYNKIQQYCKLFTALVFKALLLIMLVKQVKAAKNRPFQDGFEWWTLTGSNRRPSARQADALPAELNVHNSDDGNHRPDQLSYFLQRSRYSPVRVSILMRSPCSMNSGT